MRSSSTTYASPRRAAPRTVCRALGIFCLVLLPALNGCATKTSEPYAVNRAYRIGGIETGVVSHVGETVITERYGHENVLGGAAIGGIAGALATGMNPLGAVGGAAAGAYAGDHVTEKAVRFAALTITVVTDNGDIVTVVQEEDDVYVPGDRVRILYERDRASVRHM